MGRTSTTLLSFSFLFNYCYYYWNTKREPLQRREARGTRQGNAKWLDLRSLRFSALCWLASFTARREYLAWAYPLPRCSCTFCLFRFFPWWKGKAKYAKLPSFYASILSLVTRTPIPVSDQNNFIFNILSSWICISEHFGFSSDKDDRLIAIFLDHFRPGYPKFSKKSFV